MALHPDFWKKIDEKRKRGMSDTVILDGLSSKNPRLHQNIATARAMFATDPNIKDDKDLLNFLSEGYSGKMPTVASVPLLEEKKKEVLPPKTIAERAIGLPGEVGREVVKPVAETGLGFGRGVIKGVASTFLGATSLTEKLMKGIGVTVADKILGGRDIITAPKETMAERARKTGAVEPVTAAEKVGFGAEQLAEYVISPAAKGKLAIRTAKEAARFGGITAIQKGKIDKEVTTAAMWGAAVPVISKALPIISSGVASARKGFQEKIWTNIMSRTKNEILANPIAKDVAKLGIAKTTKQKIFNEMVLLYNKSDEVITKAIKRKEKSVNVKDIDISKIEDKLWGRVGTVRTPTKLVESEIKEMGTLLSNIKIVANTYTRGKEKISLREAYKLQLSIAREIEKSMIKADPEKAKIAKALVNELNENISKMLPKEIKKDVQKIPVLQQATVAMEKSIASGKAAQINLTEDAALVVAGLMSGTGLTPVIGRHLAFSTAAKSGFSKLMNTFNKLPSTEKTPYYLTVKGILAGYVENFVSKD